MSLACEMQGDVLGFVLGCQLRILSDIILPQETIGVKMH